MMGFAPVQPILRSLLRCTLAAQTKHKCDAYREQSGAGWFGKDRNAGGFSVVEVEDRV